MTATCLLSCEGVPLEDPETGEECPACAAERDREHAYWKREYQSKATADERMPTWMREEAKGLR